MLKISQKRFFVSWDELTLVCGTWFNSQWSHGRRQGWKTGICPPLEIGIKNQIFLEKTEVGIFIPIFWFDSCNDSFLPVWNSHRTRVRFTVIVSCSDEFAVHSCHLLYLQRWVTKVASGLFYCWSSLRNNNLETNLQRFNLYSGSRRFVAWDCWTHASWQLMQRDSDMLIAVSYVHLYFVKRSMSESTAMQPQVWKIRY